MKINLGIAPIAWSNDDMPELGGNTPIEKCLEETNSAGFTGIELGGKFPRNPGIIKYLLKRYNLKLPGGWYGSLLRKKNVDEEWLAMQEQINLLKFLDSSVFVFADVSDSIQGIANKSLDQRPKLDNSEWKQYCYKISEISNRLSDIGLPMSYHPHMGTIIQSQDDIDKFMELTNDNTFLLYDTGHLVFAEVDYKFVLNNYINRINHVHCKDIRKKIFEDCLLHNKSFRDSFLDGIFTVPGDGYIEYSHIIKILYSNNYADWLIIEAEQDPAKANPLEYAKMGYGYLSKLVKEIGYKI